METYEIRIKIREENDLYNSFDETQTTLNGDVIDYIVQKLDDVSIQEQIVLLIKSDAPIDAGRVQAAFQSLIAEREQQIQKQKRLNLLKQLRLLLIGVFFIAVALFLSDKVSPVFAELISIVGSFSVWEAANIWIVENPKMRWEKRLLQYLRSTEIVFA